MLRILVADDHAVVREGIKCLLADTVDLIVAGEARNGQEVFTQVNARTWDVLLLDITMPDRNGLEILEELRETHPTLPVLIFSMHAEPQYAREALKVGATGYLTKESVATELADALRIVAQGQRYISRVLGEYFPPFTKA